ncbi:MAG: DUF4406 domain-containing protein [Candidatus Paceibacterota bacterium]
MELSKKTKEYWTEKDWCDLKKAKTILDLFVIAERIINKMPKPIIQVCGPIGTGGLGSVDKNLNAFNNTIIKLQNEGLIVFDQMPFEEPMQKFKEKLLKGEYLESILTDFYLPIIESGFISKFYFMPGWESSHGANWEYKEAQRLGIPITYL